jgi:hypothetical protein
MDVIRDLKSGRPRTLELGQLHWLRRFRLREAVEMMVGVTELGVDRGEPLHVMADVQLVGHAHAAMQLDRLLAHVSPGATDQFLGSRNRLATFDRVG